MLDDTKILELVNRRRKCAIITHTACSKCGSYNFVLANALDMSCECERCYIERIVGELERREREELMSRERPKLDLEDFCRI